MSERRDFWHTPTIAELRDLLDKASPVPWYPTTTAGQSGALTCHASGPEHGRPNGIDWHPQAVADAYLIAAMRNSLMQLIDIVRDLALHEPRGHEMGACVMCDADFKAEHGEACPYRRALDLSR